MKSILFGIALMIFGFICLYVASSGNSQALAIAGLGLPIIGLMFAIVGMFLRDSK